MRITSIDELKKWSFDTNVNDIPYHFDYEYFRSHFLWATFVCIDKNTRKIKDDSILPIYVNILTETYKYYEGRQFVLFSLPNNNGSFDSMVNKAIDEYGLPRTKVRYCLPKSHEFYHRVWADEPIDEWQIKLFDNPVECNEYRIRCVKEFRQKLKEEEKNYSKYRVSFERVSKLTGIPVDKLTIFCPYHKAFVTESHSANEVTLKYKA